MPSVLWPFFDVNRHLLGKLPSIANDIIFPLTKLKKATPSIFTALHTFGRKLNWNTQVHLSVTKGDITKDESGCPYFLKLKAIRVCSVTALLIY